jgi:hypothetical protein
LETKAPKPELWKDISDPNHNREAGGLSQKLFDRDFYYLVCMRKYRNEN